MNFLLKFEEALMFGLSIYLFSLLPYEWWWYLALFLAPDIGMLGYLVNTKVGATTYNLFHHKGLALVLYFAGIYYASHEWQFAGLLLFGHASFDRIYGYGLKFSRDFKHTHLGKIGKA